MLIAVAMGLALAGIGPVSAASSVDAVRAPAASTVVLPPGFTQVLVATDFWAPTLMAWAPDGRLFFSTQDGQVRIVQDGVLLTKPFLKLKNVDYLPEVGMLGIAFDPAFATNHYVYVYYTSTTKLPHDQVSRFVANGNVAVAGSETVIWSGAGPLHDGYHVGGQIGFGIDGKLYIAQGDNDYGPNAQDLTTTFGKILRINSDGTIPTDDPFYTTTTGDARAIWAYGLRNPYTWAFRPGRSLMMIDDVGANTWEEIDRGHAGANYGWPITEGPTTDPQFVAPAYAYLHVETPGGECAIIGGAFYNPPVYTYPAQYKGMYFFADHCAGWIKTFNPTTGTINDFMTGGTQPVSLTVGPDGNIYYMSHPNRGYASLYKIVPASQ